MSTEAISSIQTEGQKRKTIKQGLIYLLRKAILIFLTIFLGTFITVLVVNRPIPGTFGPRPPQLDTQVQTAIDRSVRLWEMDQMNQAHGYSTVESDMFRQKLIEESGITKPFLAKHIQWTFNALRLDWGQLLLGTMPLLPWQYQSVMKIDLHQAMQANVPMTLLAFMPMTLLLVGTAYLLIFLIGLPLALHTSQRYNGLLDKLVYLLAPLSSIPSWVIGILLISLFAIELRWLPAFGMTDTIPPKDFWEFAQTLGKHMILPVTSIFLSLFFQMVYSWRTVFVTFGEEDYIDLGKAMGLKPRKLQKKYILKPTLPFVITNFSLLLISFWQMAMALEVIFQWKGIGWLYVNVGLPNFWGESMYPGELMIALSLVVMFAYLLGFVVFLLDVVYVIIDPRIRLQPSIPRLRTLRSRRKHFSTRLPIKTEIDNDADTQPIRIRKDFDADTREILIRREAPKRLPSLKALLASLGSGVLKFLKKSIQFIKQLWRFPTGVIGSLIIILFLLGSIYAVTALPYSEIGGQWGRTTLTGKPIVPKLAKPEWTNFFRKEKLSSSIVLDSQSDANRTVQSFSDGAQQITYVFSFDFDYKDFPSEIYLYLNGVFEEKKPFVALKWLTPDGREIKLKNLAAEDSSIYDFETSMNVRRVLSKNPNLEKWWNFTKIDTTPTYYMLFADPEKDTPQVVRGPYQLQLEVTTFEENSDVNAELVLLGQVYGLAGTDFLRRDLIVPLLWGMPFALLIGLVGSVLTTMLSMILAAVSVWFGGWVDDLVQRVTEINLILPILAIAVLAVAYLGISVWTILVIITLLNVFGMPLKSFRAALLQIKDAPYIEAARAYGSSSWRIILRYMVPKIIPVLVPQLIILIPGFVFLEATLGLFNITTGLPTWGTTIYQGLTKGAMYGSRYWVVQPIFLLLLTGFAFALLGFALEQVLNPRLREK